MEMPQWKRITVWSMFAVATVAYLWISYTYWPQPQLSWITRPTGLQNNLTIAAGSLLGIILIRYRIAGLLCGVGWIVMVWMLSTDVFSHLFGFLWSSVWFYVMMRVGIKRAARKAALEQDRGDTE